MRELKFRTWDKKRKRYAKAIQTTNQGWKGYRDKTCLTNGVMLFSKWVLRRFIIEQYTGLKDKNGKEIYENCELDGRYRVEYIAPEFVGKDMIKGDIIELYDNKFTITKEHCKISQNSERGID